MTLMSLSTVLHILFYPSTSDLEHQLNSFILLASRHFILAHVFHFLFPQQETVDSQILSRVIFPLLTAHNLHRWHVFEVSYTFTFFLKPKISYFCSLKK